MADRQAGLCTARFAEQRMVHRLRLWVKWHIPGFRRQVRMVHDMMLQILRARMKLMSDPIVFTRKAGPTVCAMPDASVEVANGEFNRSRRFRALGEGGIAGDVLQHVPSFLAAHRWAR
eukprot:3250383-Alexandrium_andersonii.AAC.1